MVLLKSAHRALLAMIFTDVQQITSYNKLENVKLDLDHLLNYEIVQGLFREINKLNAQVSSSAVMCRSTSIVYKTLFTCID